jgi:hypothetical protein
MKTNARARRTISRVNNETDSGVRNRTIRLTINDDDMSSLSAAADQYGVTPSTMLRLFMHEGLQGNRKQAEHINMRLIGCELRLDQIVDTLESNARQAQDSSACDTSEEAMSPALRRALH